MYGRRFKFVSSLLLTLSIGWVCACAFCFRLVVATAVPVSPCAVVDSFFFVGVARPRAALPSGGRLHIRV